MADSKIAPFLAEELEKQEIEEVSSQDIKNSTNQDNTEKCYKNIKDHNLDILKSLHSDVIEIIEDENDDNSSEDEEGDDFDINNKIEKLYEQIITASFIDVDKNVADDMAQVSIQEDEDEIVETDPDGNPLSWIKKKIKGRKAKYESRKQDHDVTKSRTNTQMSDKQEEEVRYNLYKAYSSQPNESQMGLNQNPVSSAVTEQHGQILPGPPTAISRILPKPLPYRPQIYTGEGDSSQQNKTVQAASSPIKIRSTTTRTTHIHQQQVFMNRKGHNIAPCTSQEMGIYHAKPVDIIPLPTSQMTPHLHTTASEREMMSQLPANYKPEPQQPIIYIPNVQIPHQDMKVENDNDQYDFSYKRRGKAMIFCFSEYRSETNLKPRKGAQKEAINIGILLKCLGFDVTCHFNKTKWEMETELRLAAEADHSDADCFMCILTSHGTSHPTFPESHIQQTNDVIYATDGFLYLDDVMKKFRDDNCPTLIGKPKLFFVQACRGSNYSKKVDVLDHPITDQADLVESADEVRSAADPQVEDVTSHTHDGRGTRINPWMPRSYTCLHHPVYKDFLLAYSTLPGYLSFRKQGQSWFLYQLWDQMKFCCNELELTEIMERINLVISYSYAANMINSPNPALRALHGAGQMPWIMSMLTKEVYLRPKDPRRRALLQTLHWQ